MRDFYITAILEAVSACEDMNLLDLVWKMLQDSAKIPDPAERSRLEVRTDANHSRDTRLHWAVPIQICGGSTHSSQNYSKLGNKGAELSRVCSGADSLQSAA
jgi:hypothetical protein